MQVEHKSIWKIPTEKYGGAGGNSELLVVMCGLLLALNGWRDEGGKGGEGG